MCLHFYSGDNKMSKSKLHLTSIVFLSILLSACSEDKPETNKTVNESKDEFEFGHKKDQATQLNVLDDMHDSNAKKSASITIKGQVMFQEIEGGFFGFIDEKGKKYTPIGMNKKYLRHGLIVELTGTLLPNVMTTTQFGEVIKVKSVVIIDDTKASKPDRPASTL